MADILTDIPTHGLLISKIINSLLHNLNIHGKSSFLVRFSFYKVFEIPPASQEPMLSQGFWDHLEIRRWTSLYESTTRPSSSRWTELRLGYHGDQHDVKLQLSANRLTTLNSEAQLGLCPGSYLIPTTSYHAHAILRTGSKWCLQTIAYVLQSDVNLLLVIASTGRKSSKHVLKNRKLLVQTALSDVMSDQQILNDNKMHRPPLHLEGRKKAILYRLLLILELRRNGPESLQVLSMQSERSSGQILPLPCAVFPKLTELVSPRTGPSVYTTRIDAPIYTKPCTGHEVGGVGSVTRLTVSIHRLG